MFRSYIYRARTPELIVEFINEFNVSGRAQNKKVIWQPMQEDRGARPTGRWFVMWFEKLDVQETIIEILDNQDG